MRSWNFNRNVYILREEGSSRVSERANCQKFSSNVGAINGENGEEKKSCERVNALKLKFMYFLLCVDNATAFNLELTHHR